MDRQRDRTYVGAIVFSGITNVQRVRGCLVVDRILWILFSSYKLLVYHIVHNAIIQRPPKRHKNSHLYTVYLFLLILYENRFLVLLPQLVQVFSSLSPLPASSSSYPHPAQPSAGATPIPLE